MPGNEDLAEVIDAVAVLVTFGFIEQTLVDGVIGTTHLVPGQGIHDERLAIGICLANRAVFRSGRAVDDSGLVFAAAAARAVQIESPVPAADRAGAGAELNGAVCARDRFVIRIQAGRVAHHDRPRHKVAGTA